MIDHKVFFDAVRPDPFPDALTQQQVDGMEAILTCWDTYRDGGDLRHLAYMLATTFHETAQTMWPIEEIGKGSGQDYGKTDPETGQAYYGRGFVQLTWRDNYAKADVNIDEEFGIDPNMEWEAENALVPKYAAAVMFLGMEQGWFRQHKLSDYFNEEDDNPIEARDIINGDVSKNGPMIADYHYAFQMALDEAYSKGPPSSEPEAETVDIDVTTSKGVQLTLIVNGVVKWQTP